MAISINFVSKVADIVTLEIFNDSNSFQRKYRYKYDSISEFRAFVKADIERVVETFKTAKANIGNTYRIKGQDFTIESVTFNDGYVFISVNGKKVIIYTPTRIQEVAQQIYKQAKT